MASREEIVDDNDRPIAYIETEANGRQKIMNKHFKALGYYDPTTNTTKTPNFRKLGTGNLLKALIPR